MSKVTVAVLPGEETSQSRYIQISQQISCKSLVRWWFYQALGSVPVTWRCLLSIQIPGLTSTDTLNIIQLPQSYTIHHCIMLMQEVWDRTPKSAFLTGNPEILKGVIQEPLLEEYGIRLMLFSSKYSNFGLRLFNNKKEHIGTCSNMDESQKQFGK